MIAMPYSLKAKKIEEISSIRNDCPDDLLVTCGSFEERFISVPEKIRGDCAKEFLMFRLNETNQKKEELIKKAELIMDGHKIGRSQILAEHGKSVEAIQRLHRFLTEKKPNSEELFVTVDTSTFTKDLLLNLVLYLVIFSPLKTLRLLYTIPERYASPDEGWLSSGIRSVHLPPMCWNGWSPLKDNLLITILGFEEMRAWSLIDRFPVDTNWVFITNPGSKPQWNTYCSEYNRRLLDEIPAIGMIPALEATTTAQELSSRVTDEMAERYNIFISPMGTKPQLIGILQFITSSGIPANVITTTVMSYNTPYYSWGKGDTYEFFWPMEK